jgi:Tripartite tricarboxylate transporter TctB family
MVGMSAPGGRPKVDLKELLSGLLLILIAAAFAVSALRNLSLGSAHAMGPGYFPLLVTIPLATIGLIVVARAFGRPGMPQQLVRPIALLLVLAAPIAFALTVRGLGFLGAVILTVLVSAWASRAMTARTALITTAIVAVLCAVIFYYLLRMPVQLFGPWLTG